MQTLQMDYDHCVGKFGLITNVMNFYLILDKIVLFSQPTTITPHTNEPAHCTDVPALLHPGFTQKA